MRPTFWGAMIAVVWALNACSGAPTPPPAPKLTEAQEVEKALAALRAEREAKLREWEVKCTHDNHGTAERRCSATNLSQYIIVAFVDGRGPYVQVGMGSHIDKPMSSE